MSKVTVYGKNQNPRYINYYLWYHNDYEVSHVFLTTPLAAITPY